MTSISTPEIYTDFQGLQGLKRAAREDSKAALGEVTKQFEAMFLQMMLKSMRDASFGDEIFGSQQMDAYQDMFDKQMAMHLSQGRGIGLADSLTKQLQGSVASSTQTGNNMAVSANAGSVANPQVQSKLVADYLKTRLPVIPIVKTVTMVKSMPMIKATPIAQTPSALSLQEKHTSSIQDQQNFVSPASFIQNLLPLAKSASEETGISPQVFLAQSALETGWGQGIIQHPDGRNSFNLFNIKADSRWQGDRVTKSTLEFEDGIMQQQQAVFRSYASFAESFADYITFVSNEPRYKKAMDVAENDQAFITELHSAGYATDPQYAAKVIKIMRSEEMEMARIDNK